MRFYRVAKIGTNNLVVAPTVTVLSPTNGAVLTGDVLISVSYASSLYVDAIRLFVDGEEVGMQFGSETNFVVNTCQFANGSHKIHAVVGNSTGAETTDVASDYEENYGVSPIMSVTFDNFITDYRGRLRFQDPVENETNRFTANFATYADWTLTITNESGDAVHTVTGTGFSMEYLWDGTGDGGANLPPGGYGVVLSATESSFSALALMTSKMPKLISDAIAKGEKSYFVKHPPLPPPLNKLRGPQPPIEVPISEKHLELAAEIQVESQKGLSALSGGVTVNATGDSDSGGQTTVLRPLPSVWFGSIGKSGVAYQGNHQPTGVTFGLNTRPDDGLFDEVSLNVTPGPYPKLRAAHKIAVHYHQVMTQVGFRPKFYRGNFDLTASHLRSPQYGGSGIFNDVNIGLLIGHGVYGITPDWTISGSGPLQSYYPVWSGGNGYDWVRLSEFGFGGPNLRWMAMLSCNNLQDDVYLDCYDKEALPIGDDFHLLCGSKTPVFIVSDFGIRYSFALTGRDPSVTPRLTIKEAWFFAGSQTQFRQPNNTQRTVVFRVIGWPNNLDSDDLINYQQPDSGNPADIDYRDLQVTPW